jgi:hypothetical protein
MHSKKRGTRPAGVRPGRWRCPEQRATHIFQVIPLAPRLIAPIVHYNVPASHRVWGVAFGTLSHAQLAGTCPAGSSGWMLRQKVFYPGLLTARARSCGVRLGLRPQRDQHGRAPAYQAYSEIRFRFWWFSAENSAVGLGTCGDNHCLGPLVSDFLLP